MLGGAWRTEDFPGGSSVCEVGVGDSAGAEPSLRTWNLCPGAPSFQECPLDPCGSSHLLQKVEDPPNDRNLPRLLGRTVPQIKRGDLHTIPFPLKGTMRPKGLMWPAGQPRGSSGPKTQKWSLGASLLQPSSCSLFGILILLTLVLHYLSFSYF